MEQLEHSLDEVKSLLREYRLEQLFERLCELGVEGKEDLKDLSAEDDLTDFTTVVQRRRFTKMVQERLSVPTYFGSPSPCTHSSDWSSASPSMVTCNTQDSADATIFTGEQPPGSRIVATIPPPSPSATSLVQPSPSATSLVQPSPSATSLAQPSPSATPLVQPSPSATPLVQPSPSATPLVQPSPSATPLVQPSPSATPLVRPSPSATPLVRPSPSATPLVRPSPSATPLVRPSPSATPLVRPLPNATPLVRPSPSATPLVRPYQEGEFSIDYCTLQPLLAKRETQTVRSISPAVTLQQLVDLIRGQEGKGPEVTAQLYTFEGVPLTCTTVTSQYTLEEWHVTDRSFFWVIFHSTEVKEDTELPETLPALDPREGSTQIFIKNKNTITIMVDLSNDDGQILRQKIYSKTRTPTSVISLKYSGRLIHNDQTKLQNYSIDQGSTLHMWVSPPKPLYSTWDSVFRVDLCRPIVQQSASGMSTFNSCLRVLANEEGKIKRNEEIVGHLLHMTQCPPLVLALTALFERKAINKAHKVAIHECLYQVFRAIVPTVPAMVPPNSSPADDSVFDHSIFCWTHLLATTRSEHAAVMGFELVTMTCSISQNRLKHPIKLIGGSNVFERQVVESTLDKGELIPGLSADREYTMGDFVTDEKLAQMVMACSAEEKSVLLLKPSFTAASLPLPTRPVVDSFTALGNNIPRSLKVYTPLELKDWARSSPCLTVNAKRMTVVCTGLGKGANKTHYLYDPATGKSDLHNPDDLAAQVTGARELQRPSFSKEGTITRTPKEAIVVILDKSGSMDSIMFDDLSRLDIVKELFKTFADRSMAYNYHHIIGLTLFDDGVEVVSNVSEKFALFQAVVQNVKAGGRTAVWDAMVSAAEQLDAISSTYPDCVKRILCLTDGEDNESTKEPHKVARMLQDRNIFLDCVLVGQGNTTAKAIAVATNGCAFFPSDHKESLHLFQTETVLSIRERLIGQRKAPVTNKAALRKYENLTRYPYEKKPQRTLPQELEKTVTSPGRVLQRAAANPPKGLAAPSLRRMKRILAEMAEYQRNPHPNIEIYPCEEQLDFWRVLLVGLNGTPYEGGVFLLYAKFPTDYPQVAPEIRFVTPIYHCNVNGHGKICHSVFDRNYSADFSVRRIMDCVFGLLLTPEPEDPLDSALAQEYYDNRQEYKRTAASNTKEHAKKKLEQWRKELVGSDAPAGSDVPSHLACALSGKLMSDPVMTPYGHTYERSVVEVALRKERKCPKTGKPLVLSQLICNLNILDALKDFRHPVWWHQP